MTNPSLPNPLHYLPCLQIIPHLLVLVISPRPSKVPQAPETMTNSSLLSSFSYLQCLQMISDVAGVIGKPVRLLFDCCDSYLDTQDDQRAYSAMYSSTTKDFHRVSSAFLLGALDWFGASRCSTMMRSKVTRTASKQRTS